MYASTNLQGQVQCRNYRLRFCPSYMMNCLPFVPVMVYQTLVSCFEGCFLHSDPGLDAWPITCLVPPD